MAWFVLVAAMSDAVAPTRPCGLLALTRTYTHLLAFAPALALATYLHLLALPRPCGCACGRGAGSAANVVKLLLCFNLLCTFPIVAAGAFQ
eukprot:1802905-Pyramimonas_sp.AAC.1